MMVGSLPKINAQDPAIKKTATRIMNEILTEPEPAEK